MKFVIQRVKEARLSISGTEKASIDGGLLVFVGLGMGDDKPTADKLIKKLIGLRIFADEEGKTNLSLKDVGGELLVVSQFTLYANCKKGNRPSFIEAMPPGEAEELYDYIVSECEKKHEKTGSGVFGADMQISLINDGPFTIVLDSRDL